MLGLIDRPDGYCLYGFSFVLNEFQIMKNSSGRQQRLKPFGEMQLTSRDDGEQRWARNKDYNLSFKCICLTVVALSIEGMPGNASFR